MLIDWFTVIAQIFNFLLLVYLLWRFLYKPIIKVMDRRQRDMADRWQAAEDEQQKARREAEHYRQQQQDLQLRRSHLMAEAHEQAEARRAELIKQARQDVDETRASWQEALRRDQQAFLNQLRQQVAQHTYTLTRQILRDVVDVSLEQRAVDLFIQHLSQLEEGDRQTLRQAIQATTEPVLVRSGFEMPPDQRQQILAAVRQQLSLPIELIIVEDESPAESQEDSKPNSEPNSEPDSEPAPHSSDLADYQRPLKFITVPRLICGVSLQAGGQDVGWSVHHVLQTLEDNMARQIRKEAERGSVSSGEQPVRVFDSSSEGPSSKSPSSKSPSPEGPSSKG